MANKLNGSAASSALGGNLSPDALVELVMEDARLKRAVDEANGKYRAHRAKMEKQGVNLKVLADLTRLSKLDDDERLAHLKAMFRYAGILDLKVGEQSDLFPEMVERPTEKTTEAKKLWAAEEAGYTQATLGAEADQNPYEPGSPNHQAWAKGHSKGRAFMQGKAEVNPDAGKKTKQVKEVSARRGSGRPKQAGGGAAASAGASA